MNFHRVENMTSFQARNGPKVGTNDSKHSFDEIHSMEARMEARLLTISAIIDERESTWEPFDSFDLRQTGASPSSLSSLTFGTDKSPGSTASHFKPLTSDGNVVKTRCREDSGTVCSDSTSPSPRLRDGNDKENENTPAEEASCYSGCPSTLGTPVIFEPRKWLMESPNLNSLKIESGEESIESIIDEITASLGKEPRDLASKEELVERVEEEEEEGEEETEEAQLEAVSTADLASFPEFHDDGGSQLCHFSSCQSLISIPDPHDPLLSFYFAHFPHMFAPPPCCACPQVASANGFENLPPQHHLQYPPPPLSQLQEPIVINVPNQAAEFPPFAAPSSCSIALSSSSSLDGHYPPPIIEGHPFAAGQAPPGAHYRPEEQRPPPPAPPPFLISMTQQQQLPLQQPQQLPLQQLQPASLPQLQPQPLQLSAQPLNNEIQAFPPPNQQPAYVDASGNIVASVAGTPAVVYPQADPVLPQIQLMPAATQNQTVVATPVLCAANDSVVIPQYLPEVARFVQPQPLPQSFQMTSFVVSMNFPQAAIPAAPVIAAPPPAPPLPPPPPPPPQSTQILMAQQQPVMPLHTMQQIGGPLYPVFNPGVQMVSVDVAAMPCSPVSVPAGNNPYAQRASVRPLMEIKEEEKSASKKAATKAGCVFCRSNGEREREFMGHRLKNPVTNVVECPQLRKFVCPICGATGDAAHTVSYCPNNNKWTGSTVKHLKAMRSSAGKKCGRNVSKLVE